MLPIHLRIQEALEQWQEQHPGEVPDELTLGMHETYLLDTAEDMFVIRYKGMRICMAGVYKMIKVGRVF